MRRAPMLLADLGVASPMGPVYARAAHTVGFDAPLVAPRVRDGDVRLDGTVDDWDAWPWAIRAPAPREDGAPAGWTGPADASAQVAVRLLGDDLLVAVRVTDDARVANAGRDWDAGDGPVLWLDREPDGEFDNAPYLAIPRPASPGRVSAIVTSRDREALDAVRLNVGIVDLDGAGQRADVLLRRPEWELDRDDRTAGLVRVR